MKVVDKEQERIAQEQTPEGKRKKLLSKIGTIVFFAVVFIAWYVLTSNHVLSGEPYPITVENTTIIPGETTVAELADAGYDLSDFEHAEWVMEGYTGYHYYSEVIDMTVKVDGRSYYDMILVRDGLAYAMVSIYNASEFSKPVTDCKVRYVEVHSFHEGMEQARILDVSFSEVTKEALTQSVGKEPEVSDSGRCVWEKGVYSLILKPGDDGTVESIRSEYKIN